MGLREHLRVMQTKAERLEAENADAKALLAELQGVLAETMNTLRETVIKLADALSHERVMAEKLDQATAELAALKGDFDTVREAHDSKLADLERLIDERAPRKEPPDGPPANPAPVV